MAEPKSETHAADEILSSSDHTQTNHDSDLDAVIGRDFTVDNDDLPKGYYFSLSFIGSMFAIGANLGSGTGAFSLIAPILSFIDEDIGPSPNLTWVALAYLLTTSIGFAFVGRLSDIFGRRWFYIFAAALATVGSIVAATAQSINALIAAECIMGFAASAQVLYGRKLIYELTKTMLTSLKLQSANWFP